MRFKEVYHSSGTRGVDRLVPHKSTHGESWVYATKDMVMAAVFLGNLGGDFTCAVGRDDETGKVFICERFGGAFDLRYNNVNGSIYVLPGEKFMEGKTQWDEEVVCGESVTPLREIRIDNAKECLLQLARASRLIIKFYPEKIAHIPQDDEDLVYRAVIWYKQFGAGILEQVRRYHPGLLSRVLQTIEQNRY